MVGKRTQKLPSFRLARYAALMHDKIALPKARIKLFILLLITVFVQLLLGGPLADQSFLPFGLSHDLSKPLVFYRQHGIIDALCDFAAFREIGGKETPRNAA
jgi:hypothetical protein